MPRSVKEGVVFMVEIEKESISRIDTNNMKALSILKSVLFTLINDGDCDVIPALEAVEDYLTDTNDIFDAVM